MYPLPLRLWYSQPFAGILREQTKPELNKPILFFDKLTNLKDKSFIRFYDNFNF